MNIFFSKLALQHVPLPVLYSTILNYTILLYCTNKVKRLLQHVPLPVLLDAVQGRRQPLDLGRGLVAAAGAAETAAVVPGQVVDELINYHYQARIC